jgi:methylenetetrahydrofolate reductase (NADPH)
MRTLKDLIAERGRGGDFFVLVELFPPNGRDLGPLETFLSEAAEKRSSLPSGFALAAITIPQNPRGVPALSPADIYVLLEKKGLWAGLDPIPHVTAKDMNIEAVTTYLLGLRALGLSSVLAITGDLPASGAGVFDLDALGLLDLIQDLNFESLQQTDPARWDRAHEFFALASVSPFKYTEASLVQQYFKMKKKIRAGAGAIITQMGWDARKSEELFRYLGEEKIDIPVFGNVFFLAPETPALRTMFEGKIPGCLLTGGLYEAVRGEAGAGAVERAALQVAMYRDLGAAGVDLGGVLDFNALVRILKLAAEVGPDWRKSRQELDFGPKSIAGGLRPFYLYDEEGRRRPPSKHRPKLGQRLFDFSHRSFFSPGRGLYPVLGRPLAASPRISGGRGPIYQTLRAAEHGIKSLLFGCEACGDCFLPENFGLCTIGKCAKGLPNPPCGDALTDGKCGNDPDRRCVAELIFEAAAAEAAGLRELERRVNPSRNASLRGTASIVNYFTGKDHTGRPPLILIAENLHATIPKTAAAMKALLDMGEKAWTEPSPARRYIEGQIRAQIRHGADYLDVNVDALGDSDLELRGRIMRDYVRLIRRRGGGVPVSVDSGAPEVLEAGLKAWYEGAGGPVPVPLLNAVKTYTADRLLPLKKRYPFKFIGMLVAETSAGHEGVYSVDELFDMARTLFREARSKHGFKPEEIFLDSTVFPLSIDMPMEAGRPGYTYRTFEVIRRLKADPEMKGVHLSLGITNAVKDLPARRTGVCRAYLAKAQECGLDAAIVNVLHDYGRRPPAPELVRFIDAFAGQDGSPGAGERAIEAMTQFCREARRLRRP